MGERERRRPVGRTRNDNNNQPGKERGGQDEEEVHTRFFEDGKRRNDRRGTWPSSVSKVCIRFSNKRVEKHWDDHLFSIYWPVRVRFIYNEILKL